MTTDVAVEAAGGLVWRPGSSGGTEVALVHRPKYDDWSLPKGKLEPGEHPLLAALREVAEETGARGVPGRPLGHAVYTKDGRGKRVQYWAMRWRDGEFRPGSEVDRVDWVPIETAAERLEPDRDVFVVEEFLRDPLPTRACIVVRHARAGSRDAWRGPDTDRPLDAHGRRQAQGLAPLLSAYEVSHAYSAEARRCLDTLAPFSARSGVPVEIENLFSEDGFPAEPEKAVARAVQIVQEPGSVLICSQGAALPDLVEGLCRRLGTVPAGMRPVRKGSLVVVHLSAEPSPKVVAVEQLPPPG
jgi:8-oxo-dGTP pyrophosphatase MutT (NUDIX family)/phosphohistidine phosphatase SixA